MEIQQLDSEGQPTVTFMYDPVSMTFEMRPLQGSASTSLMMRLMDVFLPAGYPLSVTADYTSYQVYDTLQAFASTIAGLLASRAVLVGMGVGSEDASLVTTMLLYIAQETIGRVATILFAHYFSQSIEAEVKFYRFFADIVNDLAFILDCLSPGLPVLGRVCTLCVSNACRAVCGVSGGSSKAILSSHFAKSGNIGELNAKDGSQETVISLIGMWAGGFVVSKVHGTWNTWCCLLPLLALHLWANWMAVKSVRLTSLNGERASILFSALLKGRVKNLNAIGKEESILGVAKILPMRLNTFRVGVSVSDFLHDLPGDNDDRGQKCRHFDRLRQIFQDEDYLLWHDAHTKRGTVLLKESATGETQAKAICHYLRISVPITKYSDSPKPLQYRDQSEAVQKPLRDSDSEPRVTPSHDNNDPAGQSVGHVGGGQNFESISQSLRQNRQQWQNLRDQAEGAGWDLSLTNLVGGRSHRVRMNDTQFEKKDQ
ncbi:hypothetical protein A1O7_06597 [Cladophialophora yegresii CBS 114405]|uniref:Protein root UVB sensitive/RUS domain-containing protein n=1 Tax=Cladophialophora yegresii CBS 114405 TaxID=1182544 RepID=W9W2D8_9EURO|nr:uncharacterized protein A1O7_06597 [Cladophialophora yegresii CBS 114405]EXJ59165.1 hypothetical protein A1O7_06597 [Cladophialophora yegresii CBS 114405]